MMKSSVTIVDVSNPARKRLFLLQLFTKIESSTTDDSVKVYCIYGVCIDILGENTQAHHYKLRRGKDFLE